jgi:hypothetical protein
MKQWAKYIFLATLAITPISCAARTITKDAVVTERDGQPCFAPSESAGMRTLNAVSVWDNSSTPSLSIWGVDIDSTRKNELVNGCVTYGQQFATGKSTDEPAIPLRTGRVYSVFLSAPGEDPRDPTRGYRAEFCLVAQPGNVKPAVRQVIWDSRHQKWPYEEVCGIRK